MQHAERCACWAPPSWPVGARGAQQMQNQPALSCSITGAVQRSGSRQQPVAAVVAFLFSASKSRPRPGAVQLTLGAAQRSAVLSREQTGPRGGPVWRQLQQQGCCICLGGRNARCGCCVEGRVYAPRCRCRSKAALCRASYGIALHQPHRCSALCSAQHRRRRRHPGNPPGRGPRVAALLATPMTALQPTCTRLD